MGIMTRTQTSFTILISLLLSGCERNCESLDNEAYYLCNGDKTTLSIEREFERPVVLANIDGKAARLLVDTGVERTIISSSFLGVEDQTYTKSVKRLCMGSGFCLEDGQYYAWDTEFSTPEDGEINGIVGIDILKHFLFEMDRGREITLAYKGIPCEGAAFPLRYTDYGSPLMDVLVDGQEIADVLLDTGTAYCLVNADTVSALGTYFVDSAIETGGCSIHGCVDDGVFLSSVEQFCIHNQCLENVATKYPVWNAVGNSYFFEFELAFDFANHRLVFCDDR